ncbi:hypothetical protein J2S40_002647 [Nocardioides luteus]|uniref:Uncharacterized protein n=1 Tax=Nocardioides luteus TaxID=1844 RepID=A0ABQ5T346_9ACTN|nr:hypothetical protein [Nocardioides luteus]MDR7311589.1 hypothetical protein [Nocardioides luteus]GGR54572.1 hypothetical protein GCM10010197_21340 [Nocardioides luteus]GLJ70238.1 hypothetical protein GCM10017579_42740 [Nocardioides luteus]
MVEDEDLGSPWKPAARRVGWSLMSLFNLLFGLLLMVGFLALDGGETGPYLIGVTCGALFVLLAAYGQLTKGVRLGRRPAHTRINRLEGEPGIEIRLRRAPGICGELMLVCFVVLLCQVAGLSFRGGSAVLGVVWTVIAAFFAVVTTDHLLTITARRALLLTPEKLTVEIAGEVVSVAWSEVRFGVFEQTSTHKGITSTNRFLEITPDHRAPTWSSARRRMRLTPKLWRQEILRVGFWLFDHPDRVLATLKALQRRRDDDARRVLLSNDATLAHLVGDLDVAPLPAGRV